jgi:hypothetical protein
MNIQIHAISEARKVLETQVFEFSDDVFRQLSKAEFSTLGASRKITVIFDGESVDLKLVLLSPFVRQALIGYLNQFLFDLLKTSLEKMGDSPSTIEYQEYTKDLKEFVEFIQCMEKEKYNYLDRMG